VLTSKEESDYNLPVALIDGVERVATVGTRLLSQLLPSAIPAGGRRVAGIHLAGVSR